MEFNPPDIDGSDASGPLCSACDGSGEGQAPDSTCPRCKGGGHEPRSRHSCDFEGCDYEEEDYDGN